MAEQGNARSGPRIFMIDGLVAGRLYGETEERTDKAGKTFTLAKVRASTADGELLFVNVIAFDAAVCAAMQVMQDGDSVALSGSLSPRVWTDKQGNARPALDMVAHRVIVLPGIGG
jgi:single-stranded DNA-binding protein